MSNSKKLWKRICESKKIPNDIKPDEFLNLVDYLGLLRREAGKGSHIVIYQMKDGELVWHTTVATGHPGNIDPAAIKELKEKMFDKK